MKVRRLEDIQARYDRLKTEIKAKTDVLSETTKTLHEKSQNRITEVTNNLSSASTDAENLYEELAHRTMNRQKFDKFDDKVLKFLKKIVNKNLAYHDNFVISESKAMKNKIDAEVSKLNMLQHQQTILTFLMNQYITKTILNSSDNEDKIHEIIDHFGELTFYEKVIEL